MDIPREQFDELLGGQEALPSAVSIIKFANARSQEISALTEAIEDPQNTHLAFQRMPKHLRRRAMSHNVKRMPRRLREVHFNQLERSGLPVKGKRPSRKFRRRPSNLLREYNRRQRRVRWLETHIWHAKRFHMVEAWGCRLPHHPNDKSFRACYRATAHHCLLQDLSYLCSIELVGPEEEILQHLSKISSTECGLTFAAKSSLGGSREGSIMLFKNGSYPFGAIGRVSFMWRPESQGLDRTLWIWCHPAYYDEILTELISIFELKNEEAVDMDVDPVQEKTPEKSKQPKIKEHKKKSCDIEKIKLETRNVGKLPILTNGKITIALLKDTLNRFRLTGPLAQVVLTEALKFVDEKFVSQDPKESNMDVYMEDQPRSAWLLDFYDESHLQSLTLQRHFWQDILPNVNSAAELPPRMIISATVMDPRLSMPSARIKAVNTGESSVQQQVPEGLSRDSPLWSAALRDTVTGSKMAAAQLNSLRSRALVPGMASPDWLGATNVSHLPLLLVQNPGCQPSGYGSGWDVISPCGWGLPLWLGLVFRGARAGGLRDTQRLSLEAATGPALPPDTAAGQTRDRQEATQRLNRHFRLPPDKRPNYVKLGVISPFHRPWARLLEDWCPGRPDQRFYVIRNRLQLDFLKSSLSRTRPVVPCTFSEVDKACGLVPVAVEVCGRGTLRESTMICTVGKKDLKLAKDKSGRGPVESLHEDVNEEQRTALRDAHLAKLKCLRRKRVRAKRELEDKGAIVIKIKNGKSPTEELVKKQEELMREMWLPSEITNIKNSSSRSVMGFVTCGDYAFTKSHSFGYGFVALPSLLAVIEKHQTLVLVRNISSLQYYFANIKVL